jgi:hypothetical protein
VCRLNPRRPSLVPGGGWVAKVIPDAGDDQHRDVQQIEVNQRVVKQDVTHASFLLIVPGDAFKNLPAHRLAALGL